MPSHRLLLSAARLQSQLFFPETTMSVSQSRPSPRILVADDDDTFRRCLAETLRANGYRVAEACNGRRAMAALGSSPVDLVITVIFMPEQDGLGLLREVRSSHPALPVIAMSGGGDRVPGSYLQVADFLGAVAVIKKPIRTDAIVALIQAAIAGPPSAGPS